MSKRTWAEANSSGMVGSSRHSTAPSRQLSLSSSARHVSAPSLPLGANVSLPSDGNSDSNGGHRHADTSPNARPLSQGSQIGAPSKANGPSPDETQITQPGITRKVKACAACRKQKVGTHFCIHFQVALVEFKEAFRILIRGTYRSNVSCQMISHRVRAVFEEICHVS